MALLGLDAKKVLFLALVFLCAFAGIRLGLYTSVDNSVAKVGSTVTLSQDEAISISNEENDSLLEIKNYEGMGEREFIVGDKTIIAPPEGNRLGIGFRDGGASAIVRYTQYEGVELIDKDDRGHNRFQMSTGGYFPGIAFKYAGERSKTGARLGIWNRDRGGRLFLSTPEYGNYVGIWFGEEGISPQFTMNTADGAMIHFEIVDGEPSLLLRDKEGNEKKITP